MPAFERACNHCGTTYTARRVTSQYCTAACRSAAVRARRATPVPDRPAQQDPGCSCGRSSTNVEAMTRRDLDQAGRIDTVEGQAALALAIRIDERADSGSALVSLVTGLSVAIGKALAGVKPPTTEDAPTAEGDPIIQLEERREQRRRRTSS